jgi:putative exporter of polyketide antibiotics
MNLIIEPVTSFFATIINSLASAVGSLALFTNDNSDGTLGLLMSALAGVATALAVAIVLAVYFRTGYRTARDMVRHGLAAAAVLGLLAFVAYDMRHAALDYLGISPAKPQVEIEVPRPKAAGIRLAEADIRIPGAA